MQQIRGEVLPPPYDTQCHNYERYGYSSRENCFSECLTDFTKSHGMMIESNVIERRKYENSSLSLAPWHLRSLRENGREITASDLKDNRLFKLQTSLEKMQGNLSLSRMSYRGFLS